MVFPQWGERADVRPFSERGERPGDPGGPGGGNTTTAGGRVENTDVETVKSRLLEPSTRILKSEEERGHEGFFPLGICLALVEAFIFSRIPALDFSRRWYLAGASIARFWRCWCAFWFIRMTGWRRWKNGPGSWRTNSKQND